jgi:4-hydroxy-2-oxoheptanedioate aldolase
MEIPHNKFKTLLAQGRQQIGLWCTLSDPYVAELMAGSGFDWLLIDTEHAPADVESVLAQLQAISAYDVAPIVRPATNSTVLIKRYLDIGVQTLLIPYVQSAAEAAQAVAAMRYAPEGVRGVSTITRATKFGRIKNYMQRAAEQLCLLVQIESVAGLDALEEIAAVEGVDGIFIGPADLAASLGHPGNTDHPDVKAAVEKAIKRIVACGKPAGVLTLDTAYARHLIACGTTFTSVGLDATLLVRATETLAQEFRQSP